MSRSARVWLTLILLVPSLKAGLWAQATHATADHADSAVVASLRKQGADLSKPTEHIFYLYFPDEAYARAAAAQIAREQTARVIHFDSGSLEGPTQDRASWMVQLTAHLTPDLTRVKEIGRWLGRVAEEHQGEYDGWEAAVTK